MPTDKRMTTNFQQTKFSEHLNKRIIAPHSNSFPKTTADKKKKPLTPHRPEHPSLSNSSKTNREREMYVAETENGRFSTLWKFMTSESAVRHPSAYLFQPWKDVTRVLQWCRFLWFLGVGVRVCWGELDRGRMREARQIWESWMILNVGS